MTPILGILLATSFVASLVALGILVWAVANKLIFVGKNEAETIFMKGELGQPDDSASFGGENEAQTHRFDVLRAGIDRSGRGPVLLLVTVGITWLLIGSVFGVMASLKLHWPDWLADMAQVTFGRARTLHLNIVAYGWLSVTGIGVALWLLPRIFHTPLRRPNMVYFGAALWTLGVLGGTIAVANGWSDGIEWLEFPWQIDILLAVGGFFLAWPAIETAANRKSRHIYVSGWYFLAGMVWFPFLFLVSNIPGLHIGAQQATVNWWFAHNVLGLWLTPMGVGAAYYIIPKIIGKPVYSYNVSLLGFWSLALFYSQVGIHHLMGGPVPTWAVTLSVVHSIMMFVPVIAVAINQHVTVAQNLWAFKQSMALRFVWIGALMYTLSSFQGSLEAIRSVNSVTHFTHYTVGHAHLGAYGFVSMVMFGTLYYMMPHILGRRWPFPALIKTHFWLVTAGFTIYVLALSIAGVVQGMGLMDPGSSFGEITRKMVPYLEARSIGGTMMTLGHFVFAAHFALLLLRKGSAVNATPTLARADAS
ncbi:cbb3-type cytochrome c oxidase subunit I [Alcaligenes nematophilus]|uniref:cbb3-type cytochrome c oxidase subunit I n=1 Tax=Alcaligenes nematophilus TaxID=2994643 RepID=UPI0035B50F62